MNEQLINGIVNNLKGVIGNLYASLAEVSTKCDMYHNTLQEKEKEVEALKKELAELKGE